MGVSAYSRTRVKWKCMRHVSVFPCVSVMGIPLHTVAYRCIPLHSPLAYTEYAWPISVHVPLLKMCIGVQYRPMISCYHVGNTPSPPISPHLPPSLIFWVLLLFLLAGPQNAIFLTNYDQQWTTVRYLQRCVGYTYSCSHLVNTAGCVEVEEEAWASLDGC